MRGPERVASGGQLSQAPAARQVEQARQAERAREAAERLAETEAALSEARDGQQKLLEELAVSMYVQERDLQEAERLRTLLAQREAESEARERQHAAVAEAADAALKDALSRLAAAEEEVRRQREELDAQAAIASAQEAAARRHQAAAERLALSSIARAVRIWRDARQAAAADDESTQHFTSSTTQDGVDSDAPLTRAAFWADTGAARAVADEGGRRWLDGGQVETCWRHLSMALTSPALRRWRSRRARYTAAQMASRREPAEYRLTRGHAGGVHLLRCHIISHKGKSASQK